MNIEKAFTERKELLTRKGLKSSQEGPGLAYKFSGQFCSSTPQAGVNMLPGSKGHCCASLLHFCLRVGKGFAYLAENLGGTQVVVGSVGNTGLEDQDFLLGEKIGLVVFH